MIVLVVLVLGAVVGVLIARVGNRRERDRVLRMRAAAAAAPPAPPPSRVVDSRLRRKVLRADATAITHGDKTLPLDKIGWVSYTAVRTTTRRPFGPNSHEADWTFECGAPGSSGRDSISITFMGGKHATTPPEWASLVAISQAHLEPRLLAEHHHRVLAGETVEVATTVITRGGVVLRSGVLPWSEVTARIGNGVVHVFRRGVDRAVVSVPLKRPNAVLLTRLVGALGSTGAR